MHRSSQIVVSSPLSSITANPLSSDTSLSLENREERRKNHIEEDQPRLFIIVSV